MFKRIAYMKISGEKLEKYRPQTSKHPKQVDNMRGKGKQ